MPSGRFLMEDFYYAGGLRTVMRALLETKRLHGDAVTVSGQTVAQLVTEAANYNPEVIRPLDRPLTDHGGIAVLRRHPAPHRAVLQPPAATPALMQPRGQS